MKTSLLLPISKKKKNRCSIYQKDIHETSISWNSLKKMLMSPEYLIFRLNNANKVSLSKSNNLSEEKIAKKKIQKTTHSRNLWYGD
jgi:hypothetical protein